MLLNELTSTSASILDCLMLGARSLCGTKHVLQDPESINIGH